MENKILTAGERLFPPVKESNLGIFHYHKGRVARIPSGLTPKAKAVGLVTKRSESFVKCDKASKGIKTAHHMHEAADYIARNGKVDLEDENGNTLSRDDLHSTVKDWCTDQEVPETQEDLLKTKKGEKRPADARRIVISCPKGSDPEAVKKAAKEFAEEFFKANGYRYVFGLHCKSEETPNEPDHPHIHFLIKSVSIDGKRLNIRKADLQLMRERFAIIARKYGIELNATSRTVRGESEKAKNIERYHHEKRQSDYKHQAYKSTDKGPKKTEEEKRKAAQAKEHIRKRKAKEKKKEQSQSQKWAFSRKKQAKEPQSHPYSRGRTQEVIDALKSGQNLKEHDAIKKAKKTREEVKKNIYDYAQEIKSSGSKVDKKLASELEKMEQQYKPVKSAQQSILDKARERLKKEREKNNLHKDNYNYY